MISCVKNCIIPRHADSCIDTWGGGKLSVHWFRGGAIDEQSQYEFLFNKWTFGPTHCQFNYSFPTIIPGDHLLNYKAIDFTSWHWNFQILRSNSMWSRKCLKRWNLMFRGHCPGSFCGFAIYWGNQLLMLTLPLLPSHFSRFSNIQFAIFMRITVKWAHLPYLELYFQCSPSL